MSISTTSRWRAASPIDVCTDLVVERDDAVLDEQHDSGGDELVANGPDGLPRDLNRGNYVSVRHRRRCHRPLLVRIDVTGCKRDELRAVEADGFSFGLSLVHGPFVL
jgi:hypothetical protein